jgi:hypothetical protein
MSNVRRPEPVRHCPGSTGICPGARRCSGVSQRRRSSPHRGHHRRANHGQLVGARAGPPHLRNPSSRHRIRASARLSPDQWQGHAGSSPALAVACSALLSFRSRAAGKGPRGTHRIRSPRKSRSSVLTMGACGSSGASQEHKRERGTCRVRCLVGTIRHAKQAGSPSKMTPNPSIEGTSTSKLRLLRAAPHVKR